MSEQSIADALVQVDDLTVRFRVQSRGHRGYIEPVSHVSFHIASKEVLALVGESGSGKTTIGRALLKIVEPTQGRIYFGGRDITHLTPRAIRQLHADVQLIFQDPFGALNPAATIQDHLALPLTVYRHVSPQNMEGQVNRLLNQVGLVPADEIRFKHPHELSGGQRQRVVIARALAVEPRFIVADEPVSMLDVSIRAEILKILNDLKSRLGISLLYITHDLTSARYLADRIMVLYGGNIMEVGEADDLVLEPRHPYTQLLLAAVPGPTEAAVLPQVSEAAPNLSVGRRGCPFVMRCPQAMEVCRDEIPPLLSVEGSHLVACHLVPAP